MSASTRMDSGSLLALGIMYRQLGGSFIIDSTGKRWTGFTEFNNPHDRVVRICEGLIRDLGEEDRDFLFDAFAICSHDPENITATFEEPKRRAA